MCSVTRFEIIGWLRSRWYWLVYWCLLHRVAVLTCCSKVCWRCTSQSSCSSCTPAGASSTMVTFREQSATGMAAAIRGGDDGAELFLTKSWRSLNCFYQTVWTLILRLASLWSNDLQEDLKLNLLTPLWNPVGQNQTVTGLWCFWCILTSGLLWLQSVSSSIWIVFNKAFFL